MQVEQGRCQLFVNSGTFEALDRLTLWRNGFIYQAGVCRVIQYTLIYDRPAAIYRIQWLCEILRVVPHYPKLVYRAEMLVEVTEVFAQQYLSRTNAELELAH